jgi:hypothetical protein
MLVPGVAGLAAAVPQALGSAECAADSVSGSAECARMTTEVFPPGAD